MVSGTIDHSRLFLAFRKLPSTLTIKRISLITLLLAITVLFIVPVFYPPFARMEEFNLIRHRPPHAAVYPDEIPIFHPANKDTMIHAILTFPLAADALATYVALHFMNVTIVEASIYETVSKDDHWLSSYELKNTFVLLKVHHDNSHGASYATIESDGRSIHFQDDLWLQDSETVLTYVGRLPRNSNKAQPKLIIEGNTYSLSVVDLLNFLEYYYRMNLEKRDCSHNREFSKMVFNRLSTKKKWDWKCSYREKINSFFTHQIRTVLKSIGLRFGDLWAKRIRYFIYPQLKIFDIPEIGLLLLGGDVWSKDTGVAITYDISRHGQFYIDLKTLDLLNDEHILPWKLKDQKRDRPEAVFQILKFRVPVFDNVYIPFLSEYLLYNSFVVVGYDFHFQRQRIYHSNQPEWLIRPQPAIPLWISIEKYGLEIVIQTSYRKEDVIYGFMGEQRISSPFWQTYYPELMEDFTGLQGNVSFDRILFSIWETNELRKSYHFLFDNCQRFADTIYDKLIELKEDFPPDRKAMWLEFSVPNSLRKVLIWMYPIFRAVFRLTSAFTNCAVLRIVLVFIDTIVSKINRELRLILHSKKSLLVVDLCLLLCLSLLLRLIVIAERLSLYLFWLYEDFLTRSIRNVLLKDPMEKSKRRVHTDFSTGYQW